MLYEAICWPTPHTVLYVPSIRNQRPSEESGFFSTVENRILCSFYTLLYKCVGIAIELFSNYHHRLAFILCNLVASI